MEKHGQAEARDAVDRLQRAVARLELRLSSGELSAATGTAAEVAFIARDIQARLDHIAETAFADRYDAHLNRARRRLALDRPLRTHVAEALDRFGATARPREIAAFVEAVSGRRVPVRAFSSLRRDERRSWERKNRSVFVVPALNGMNLTPARGRVCLSSWPIESRLLTPLAERADTLTALERVARWLVSDEAGAPPAAVSLIRGWAEAATGQPMLAVDLDGIADAAAEANGRVEDEVRLERRAAARRARELLSGDEHVWGREPGWLDREAAPA